MLYPLLAFQHRIGFFGETGPIWFFLGFVFLVAVCAVVWRLTDAVGKAVGISGPWMLVLYWAFVLFCLVVFWNYGVAHWF